MATWAVRRYFCKVGWEYEIDHWELMLNNEFGRMQEVVMNLYNANGDFWVGR